MRRDGDQSVQQGERLVLRKLVYIEILIISYAGNLLQWSSVSDSIASSKWHNMFNITVDVVKDATLKLYTKQFCFIT